MSKNHADHRRLPWRQWGRLRRRALDRDDWRCVRCESPLDLEVHHVIPLDQGGPALDLGNVETLCRDCHIDAHMDPERRAWRLLLAEGI